MNENISQNFIGSRYAVSVISESEHPHAKFIYSKKINAPFNALNTYKLGCHPKLLNCKDISSIDEIQLETEVNTSQTILVPKYVQKCSCISKTCSKCIGCFLSILLCKCCRKNDINKVMAKNKDFIAFYDDAFNEISQKARNFSQKIVYNVSNGSTQNVFFSISELKKIPVYQVSTPIFIFGDILSSLANEHSEDIHPVLKLELAKLSYSYSIALFSQKRPLADHTKKQYKENFSKARKFSKRIPILGNEINFYLQCSKVCIELLETIRDSDYYTEGLVDAFLASRGFGDGDIAKEIISTALIQGWSRFRNRKWYEQVWEMETIKFSLDFNDTMDTLKKLERIQDISAKNINDKKWCIQYESLEIFHHFFSCKCDDIKRLAFFGNGEIGSGIIFFAYHENWRIRHKAIEILLLISNDDTNNTDIVKHASLILEKIKNSNSENKEEIVTLIKFQKDFLHWESLAQREYEEIKSDIEQLFAAETDKIKTMLKFANKNIKEIKDIVQKISKEFESNALQKLTKIKNCITYSYKNDPFLNTYISPKACENEYQCPADLLTKTMDFLNCKDKAVFLIKADAGLGKSTFLKYLEYYIAENFSSLKNAFPIFLELANDRDPDEFLKKNNFSFKEIDEIKLEGTITFLLDGFDEMKDYRNCVDAILKRWPNSKIVITCRTSYLQGNLGDYRNLFSPIYMDNEYQLNKLQETFIAEFNYEQIEEFCAKYAVYLCEIGEIDVDSHKLYDTIINAPNLESFIKTPFLLRLVIEVLLHSNKRGEDLTKHQLYSLFANKYFQRECNKFSLSTKINKSIKKFVSSGMLIDALQSISMEIACQMRENNVQEMLHKKLFINKISIRGCKYKLNPFEMQELIKINPLIVSGNKQLQFLYVGFIDYFYSLKLKTLKYNHKDDHKYTKIERSVSPMRDQLLKPLSREMIFNMANIVTVNDILEFLKDANSIQHKEILLHNVVKIAESKKYATTHNIGKERKNIIKSNVQNHKNISAIHYGKSKAAICKREKLTNEIHIFTFSSHGNFSCHRIVDDSLKTILQLKFSPSEKFLLCIDENNNVNLWDTTVNLLKFNYKFDEIDCLEFSKDERYLCIVSNDALVIVDIDISKIYLQKDLFSNIIVQDIVFSEDNSKIMLLNHLRTFCIYNFNNQELKKFSNNALSDTCKSFLSFLRQHARSSSEITSIHLINNLIDDIEDSCYVVRRGSDDFWREKFVNLQSCFESVFLALMKKDVIKNIVGIIHTPTPATPLCIASENIPYDDKREHAMENFMTVKSRVRIIKELVKFKDRSKLFVAYYKDRSEGEMAIYRDALRKNENIVDIKFNCEYFDLHMVGASYVITTDDDKKLFFSLKGSQINEKNMQFHEWAIWFGELTKSIVEKRIREVFSFLNANQNKEDFFNVFL